MPQLGLPFHNAKLFPETLRAPVQAKAFKGKDSIRTDCALKSYTGCVRHIQPQRLKHMLMLEGSHCAAIWISNDVPTGHFLEVVL